MTPDRPLTCDEADALAGAWALDALDPTEADAVAAHLESCDQPHAELRAAAGAGLVLGAALEPMQPSHGLRDRIMASIGQSTAPSPVPWYRRPWLPRAAAGLAAAAVVALAAWNVWLQGELGERDAELRRVAAALSSGGAAHAVNGSVGGGLLITGQDGPLFVASLEPPGDGRIYEMWLIDAEGRPQAVGTFSTATADDLVVAALDRGLEGFATFAITVEQRRVETPTTDPVLAAPLT